MKPIQSVSEQDLRNHLTPPLTTEYKDRTTQRKSGEQRISIFLCFYYYSAPLW